MARILSVEDEIIFASNLEALLQDLGHETVGTAADMKSAMSLATHGADVAFVDLSLRDGFTGPQVGAELADRLGITVVYLTANPRMAFDKSGKVVGGVSKPLNDDMIEPVVEFALQLRNGNDAATPPKVLQALDRCAA
jgi:two-component system, response regulator PdtaR